MRRTALALAVFALLVAPGVARGQGILGTKHNLSVTGPGPIKAQSETQVCVFCHTPHNANPSAPLWNHQQSGQSYDPYASNTLQAQVGQPNGYSKLCLSCHDGTIAIGSVRNLGGQPTTIAMRNVAANGAMPTTSTALLGTNLTNDHPISFIFDSTTVSLPDGELVDPTTLTGDIHLYFSDTDRTRQWMQCTTCHDPHRIKYPYFLRKPFTGQTGSLCLVCHIKPGWPTSSHYAATSKSYPTTGGSAVSDLSCGACHRPHTSEGMPRLLRLLPRTIPSGATGPPIEQTCFRCHSSIAPNGTSPATYDLETQLAKANSLHRITAYTGHEPVFTTAGPKTLADTRPEPVAVTQKHVECPDCHNPHRVQPRGTDTTCGGRFTGRTDVACSGRYEGMRGIQIGGQLRDDVTQDSDPAQWEICFRCHGDTVSSVFTPTAGALTGDGGGTAGNPGSPGTLVPAPNTIDASNKRIEFDTSNSAYHPVVGSGRNTSQNLNDQFAWLASLGKQPSSISSTILCTDCHNNDYYSGSTYRGTVSQYTSSTAQPVGPHGSWNFNLLRARVWNALPGPSTWNSTNFDLCFHCHDVEKLFGVTTRPRDFASGARTNYDDEDPGCKSAGLCKGRGNLHYFHVVDRVSNSQPVCKDCHFNVHSNVEASNTQYRITTTDCNTTSGTLYQTPPRSVPSHLVNFRPTVLLGISGRAKPEWCFNTVTKVRQCFVQCHKPDGTAGGPVMSGFGYKPPQGDM